MLHCNRPQSFLIFVVASALLFPVVLHSSGPALAAKRGGKAAMPARTFSLDAPVEPASTGITPLSGFADTVWFGGTAWDPVDMRWEALRDSVWTFETGVGSSINTDPAVKAVGLHRTMEGWEGLDLTDRSAGLKYLRHTSLCALAGSYSLHAGATESEADSLCWASGQGYGNNLAVQASKSFSYPGSGSVTLHYSYAVEVEPGFDYTCVAVDTSGNGSANPIVVKTYTGTVSGNGSVVLNPGTTLPSTPGSIRILFQFLSDASYSDEDGFNPTVCGHSTIDNVTLSGAITDLSNFESGYDGWVIEAPEGSGTPSDVGDWSDIRAVADLPFAGIDCTCSFQDSMLVFFDPSIGTDGGHPLDQNNIVLSPWIPMDDPVETPTNGMLIEYEGYFDIPLENYVFIEHAVQWEPLVCVQGGGSISSLSFLPNLEYSGPGGTLPDCACRPCPFLRPVTTIVPSTATALRIGVGVLNLCRTAPFGVPCAGGISPTPWIDNIRVGFVSQRFLTVASDRPTDVFPKGNIPTPLVSRTARCDAAYVPPGPANQRVHGDTLIVRSSSASAMEVVLRVRPGPGIDAPALSTWLGGLTNEGDGWYSARMDTAEVGGSVSPGIWMTSFHESDPGFSGSDTDLDPNDPGPGGAMFRLKNDIIPDGLFTPGTRIDLFYRGTFPPPVNSAVYPDTTGGFFVEMEVLPSSIESNGDQNSVLLVNRTSETSTARANIEAGLAVVLPGSSANAEGVTWDRVDIPYGANTDGDLDHLGDPAPTMGGSMDGYQVVLWCSGGPHADAITAADAAAVLGWAFCPNLAEFGGGGCDRGLYFTGDDIATSLDLLSRLDDTGIELVCSSFSTSGCPVGTPADPSLCVEVHPDTTSHFDATGGWAEQPVGTRCVPQGSFDVIRAMTPAPLGYSVEPNLVYDSVVKGEVRWASMSTNRSIFDGFGDYTGTAKYVVDGFSVHHLAADASCSDPGAIVDRLGEVIAWLQTPGGPASAAPESGAPPARPVFEMPRPNPVSLSNSVTLRFSVPAKGRAVIHVFDVAGRRVRTVLDGTVEAGWAEVNWDTRDDGGRSVAAGLYFVRLGAAGERTTRKVVVQR